MPCPKDKAKDTSMIPAAVAAAKAADVAVLFLGSDQTTEAENYDRDSLGLVGVQEQLLKAVVEAQPNTVVVLIHGGPVALSDWAQQHVKAVVDAFYPGELGGDAIVDTLLGADGYNRFGRMPYTVYYSNFTDHRDIRQVDLQKDGGVTYRWFSGPVQWEFGAAIVFV